MAPGTLRKNFPGYGWFTGEIFRVHGGTVKVRWSDGETSDMSGGTACKLRVSRASRVSSDGDDEVVITKVETAEQRSAANRARAEREGSVLDVASDSDNEGPRQKTPKRKAASAPPRPTAKKSKGPAKTTSKAGPPDWVRKGCHDKQGKVKPFCQWQNMCNMPKSVARFCEITGESTCRKNVIALAYGKQPMSNQTGWRKMVERELLLASKGKGHAPGPSLTELPKAKPCDNGDCVTCVLHFTKGVASKKQWTQIAALAKGINAERSKTKDVNLFAADAMDALDARLRKIVGVAAGMPNAELEELAAKRQQQTDSYQRHGSAICDLGRIKHLLR